jgi:creatinine amidohydrolase
MSISRDRDLAARSWTQLDAVLKDPARRAVALLPIGATEPHGPHLPLETDVIISMETARRAAARLAGRGVEAFVLPPIPYSITDFSKDFSGAIGVTHATSLALVSDVCRAALSQGFNAVCLVNSHLEPDHLAVLREAAANLSAEGKPVLFPDKTLRRWAETLTDEFRSGACHAGRYETSLVMATDAELVDEAARRGLPPVGISIGRKIKEGAKTFREAGGDLAYFGDPAAATSAEGESSYEALAAMVETTVMTALTGV